MNIDEQQRTYDAFIKISVRSAVAVIAVVAFLAAFVA